MAKVKTGDVVKIHYTGKLTDGIVFDSSINRNAPIEFKVGEGQVIPGFEDAVIDMEIGENKTVQISSEKAYGPYRKELIHKVGRDRLPQDLLPEVGQQLQASHPDGHSVVVTIIEVADDTITIDANHPLAGKDLIFDIKLEEIVNKE